MTSCLNFYISEKNEISSDYHMIDFPEICRHLPSVTQQNQRHQNQEQVLWPEYSANIPPHQKFSLAYLFPGLSVWAAVSNMEPWPVRHPAWGGAGALQQIREQIAALFTATVIYCTFIPAKPFMARIIQQYGLTSLFYLALQSIESAHPGITDFNGQKRATEKTILLNTCDKHEKKIGAWNLVHFQLTLSRLRDLNLEFQKLKCVFSKQGPVQNIQRFRQTFLLVYLLFYNPPWWFLG